MSSGRKKKRSVAGQGPERSHKQTGAFCPPSRKAASVIAPITLVVADIGIRQDAEGRFSLNDLHRAAGGNRRHGPGRWTRTDSFGGLVRELEPEMALAPVQSVRGGAAPGTYVCEDLVYAYAMWISPKFCLRVIRAAKLQIGRQRDSLFAQRLCLEARDAGSRQLASIGSLLMHDRRHQLPAIRSEREHLEAVMQPLLFPSLARSESTGDR